MDRPYTEHGFADTSDVPALAMKGKSRARTAEATGFHSHLVWLVLALQSPDGTDAPVVLGLDAWNLSPAMSRTVTH